MAIDVNEIVAFAATDEKRLAADGAERAGRAIHAAGNELPRAGERGRGIRSILHGFLVSSDLSAPA